MSHRIIYDNWQLVFPVVALAVASCVYLAAAWQAIRAKAPELERQARRPLED